MTTAELSESAKNMVSDEVENLKGYFKRSREVIEFVFMLVLPILTPIVLMCLSNPSFR